MTVVNVSPDLQLRPTWLVAEIDIDYEKSKQAADESWGKGIRTGASRDYEAEMRWAVDRWIDWMDKKGCIFIGPKGGPLVSGPFLPVVYDNRWPLYSAEKDADGDPLELPRIRETSVEQTGGRVIYRLAAMFLVREHILREIVERDKEPERWAGIAHARKENGIWTPQKPPPKTIVT